MSQLATDFLEQARRLARSDARRPKQANLRRAISTAYYALFHLLVDESATFIVSAGARRRPLRHLVGRAFLHAGMKAACTEIRKGTPIDILKPFWPALGISHSLELQNLAEAFRRLQEQRHRADYDLSITFTREEALAAVERATQAFADWQTLKRTQPEIARFFALSLLLIENWRKR